MEINNELFNFIWNSRGRPVKREVLYKNRDEGGLGLLNMCNKAKSIFY